MTDFSYDYLNDGYISRTFGLNDTENYMAILFRTNAQHVAAKCGQNGAFYVVIKPPLYTPPAAMIYGQNAWLIDYKIRSGGSVVPQSFWSPELHSNSYIDHAQLRVPVFFVNTSGKSEFDFLSGFFCPFLP